MTQLLWDFKKKSLWSFSYVYDDLQRKFARTSGFGFKTTLLSSSTQIFFAFIVASVEFTDGTNVYEHGLSFSHNADNLAYKTHVGYRTLSEFAKKETLRIVPQQYFTIKRDTVQLTYPYSWSTCVYLLKIMI